MSYSGKGDKFGIMIGLAAAHPYSTDTYMAFRVACLSLSRKLSGVMACHGFHVDLSSRFITYPQEIMEMIFTLTPVPESGLPEGVTGGEGRMDEALVLVKKTLEEKFVAPVDAAELASCKALLANEYSMTLSDPEGYADAILMRYSAGKDVLTGYNDKIAGVTADKVKEIFGALAGGMKVEYVEGPQE